MVASINNTTLAPTSAVKIYTNSGDNDVIATLDLVSQTATKNPKVNVAYSSNAEHTMNGSYNASWSLSNSVGADACPISLSTETSTKGKTPYGISVTDGTQGVMTDISSSSSDTDSVKNNQFLDPYFLISPTSYNSAFTTPLFAKKYSSSTDLWKDFREPMEDSTMELLFGVNGGAASYQTGTVQNYTGGSYHNHYWIYDAYTMVALGASNNGYMSVQHFYTNDNTFDGSSWSGESGNRTSNSCIYDEIAGNSYSSYDVPTAQQPWARSFSCDNGVFVIDTTRYSGKQNIIILNMGGYFTDFTSTSSIDSVMTSNRGHRVELAEAHSFRWVKWNPHTSKWYICIGGSSNTSKGLYSFDDTSTFYNSDTGNGAKIETITGRYTKEEAFDFPDEKMTIPARLANKLWLSYTSAGVAYYSTDLITWTLASADSVQPSDMLMKNIGSDGKTYYGSRNSSVVKYVSSGYENVDKAGWIESETEVGRYERSGIIIPKGTSLYVENVDAETSVSVNLLTMGI